MFNWNELGIKTYGRQKGEAKLLCPRCSAERKNKTDKCLSVNLDSGLFNCHHCEWSGKASEMGGYQMAQHWERPKKTYTKPVYEIANEPPANKLLDWFAARAIPASVVTRHKVEVRIAWMPQTNRDERTIAFPYFRDGDVINVKYRTAAKQFRMEKGAETCLYGLDDIGDSEDLIFVEGEIDKLSCEVAGFTNCVSVPNGADSDLDCLGADESRLAHVKRFILAVDADEKGKKLEAKLISRLGRDRCWLVEWPKDCKDANDVLVKYGAEKLRDCVASARAIPIEGVFEINDIRERIFELYERGTPTGAHPGWDALKDYYRPVLGQWTAVIAIPGSGKTSWMAALMINLAIRHGWKFAVFPAENLPAEEYASLLAEIFTGLPFNQGPNERMSKAELSAALDWLHEHFIILNPNDDELDLDSLLSMAKAYCLRRGINGFVIDPWNELDHKQPAQQTETQYVSNSLIKVRRFAKTHNIHVWIVVHPTKLAKDKEGKYPVPTLYDASGSSHWRNKADFGISIYRHFDNDDMPTEIHVQKVRWKWCGGLGMAELYFDKLTGRYDDRKPASGVKASHKIKNEAYKEYLESMDCAEEIPSAANGDKYQEESYEVPEF